MKNTVWITLAAFGAMLVLYCIGYVANIDALTFKISSTQTEISLVPIFIGLCVAYIGDRKMKSKAQ